MKGRKVVRTADGSQSIFIPEWNEHYHSHHGALQESMHVFIQAGLAQLSNPHVSIFEMGFGTGLNALLSLCYAKQNQISVDFTSLEAFPVGEEEWMELSYPSVPGFSLEEFRALHSSNWGIRCSIGSSFSLLKLEEKLQNYHTEDQFDLIYYDAFGARVQPELWEPWVFEKMYKILRKDGILVTYSSKGSVRRAMLAAGFEVEKLQGPPGKREMLRAIRR